jgi:hypothetical protein
MIVGILIGVVVTVLLLGLLKSQPLHRRTFEEVMAKAWEEKWAGRDDVGVVAFYQEFTSLKVEIDELHANPNWYRRLCYSLKITGGDKDFITVVIPREAYEDERDGYAMGVAARIAFWEEELRG